MGHQVRIKIINNGLLAYLINYQATRGIPESLIVYTISISTFVNIHQA